MGLALVQWNHLSTKISRLFNVPKPQVTASNAPLADYLKRAEGRADSELVQYPFLWLKPNTVSLNSNVYNPARMAKSPRAVLLGETSNGLVTMRLIPTMMVLEMGYATNDFEAYAEFGSRWVALSRSGQLNFDFLHNGVRLSVRVEPGESWEIPNMDQGEDKQELMGMVQITMEGYVELGTPQPTNYLTPTVRIGTIPPEYDAGYELISVDR